MAASVPLALALLVLPSAACEIGSMSPGVEPPNDELFFPQGLLLDPRISQAAGDACSEDAECGSGACVAQVCREPARWLLVANGNSDLTYNAASMIPFDLDAFFAAFEDTDNIGAPGSKTSADRPCRKAELNPQLIECDETHFAAPSGAIHFGDFAMQPVAWDCEVVETSPAPNPGEPRPQRRLRHCELDEAMILTPINGDPSVTYAYLRGGLEDDDIRLECGQGEGSGRADPRVCSDDFRIRFYRNDPDALKLPRELTTMRVVTDPHNPLAFITHRAASAVTLLKLDGLRGGQDVGDWQDPYGPVPESPEIVSDRQAPAIVDYEGVFAQAGGGGFGLAERPCDPEDPPAASRECTRPLLYAMFRRTTNLARLTSTSVDPSELGGERSCLVEGATPEGNEVDCDPKIDGLSLVSAGGLNDLTGGGVSFADIEFSVSGEELFVVQSAPGALIRMNTGVDALGDTIDEPNALVELCDRPSSLTIYNDGSARYGLTTCYRSASVFIVDLDTMSVVTQLRAGTGPNRLIPDLAREVVYVANTLDATISVIDMSRTRPTRFSEVARLGLQEPFEQ